MSETTPTVAAIVLNWNRPADTMACLDTLLHSDYGALDLVVVDNGSTDDSVAQLRRAYGTRITVVETGRNLLFGGGSNYGLRYALRSEAQFLLLLNNDTIVAADAVSLLVEGAQRASRAGVVAPWIHHAGDADSLWSAGTALSSWSPLPVELARRLPSEAAALEPYRVAYVTGCAMLLRRAALRATGLFDRAYAMYYEDADLCARMRAAGYEVWVVPRARVAHAVGASSKLVPDAMRYHQVSNRVRFYRQHAHGEMPWLTHALLVGQTVARAGWDMVRGRQRLARAALRGLHDGYRHALVPAVEPAEPPYPEGIGGD